MRETWRLELGMTGRGGKKLSLSSQKYGIGIRDPEKTYSGSRGKKCHRNPDPQHCKISKKNFWEKHLKAGTGHHGIDGKSPAPPVHRPIRAELPPQLLPSHPQLWRPVRPFAPRAHRDHAPRRVHQAERIVAALCRTSAVEFDAQRLRAGDADVAGEGDVVCVRVDALLCTVGKCNAELLFFNAQLDANEQCWGSVTFWCGSGSAHLTNGSGSNSGSDSFLQWL